MLASTVDGARVHAGMSFTRLSELSGIEPEALAELLEGQTDFTVVDLVGIATALDIPITRLLPVSAADDC
ncbi:helix-turn-helix domain-containing protein [Microbacterium sp. K22]|uniref:helix-turn-helix domain-containing protein n=1 Tax=Microbacterium sp. K22 TaxID=2305447 RepID=UPI00109C1955|nr:helix-turn-helix transcriptional regulator [Microbacterium sp. K22]